MSKSKITNDNSEYFLAVGRRLGIPLNPTPPKGGAYAQLVKDVSAMMQKENLEHPYNPLENVRPDPDNTK